MIKIFRGAGVVTPSKPPPPYEQLLPLPTPYFKMFLERSLNDPPTPHHPTSSIFHCYAPPHPPPLPPLKNFDHTLSAKCDFRISHGTANSARCTSLVAMFKLYRIVKRSVTESVLDRASVHTRNTVFEAFSAPEQY